MNWSAERYNRLRNCHGNKVRVDRGGRIRSFWLYVNLAIKLPRKKGLMKKDNSEVWERVEAQLEALNRKLDILIKQSSQKPAERSSFSERSSYSDRRPERGSGRGFDDRPGKMQFKAICAECGQTCGVPFKPSGGRPVYCSECFSKQQEQDGEEPRSHKPRREFPKPAGAKKPFFKKR